MSNLFSTDILTQLQDGLTLTGHPHLDVPAFLHHHGYPKTAQHCGDVAAASKRIALLFGEDPHSAEIAGWLHDCSAVFPNTTRLYAAQQLNIPILPEEAQVPMIIHQKLSRALATHIFKVTDESILSAVECHTTLKAHASRLDKVLFVADKIAWDQEGIAPYHDELIAALDTSLNTACFVYLNYLWQKRDTIPVVHPWMLEAYKDILSQSTAKLYILCGLPYSGKTTLQKKLTQHMNIHAVSVDRIMDKHDMWRDGHPTQTDWDTAYSEAYQEIQIFLKKGQLVIFDCANLPFHERENARTIANQVGASHQLIHINTSKEEILQRQLTNEETQERGHLTQAMMDKAFKMFDEPTASEHPIVYNQHMDLQTWINRYIHTNNRK